MLSHSGSSGGFPFAPVLQWVLLDTLETSWCHETLFLLSSHLTFSIGLIRHLYMYVACVDSLMGEDTFVLNHCRSKWREQK